MGRTTRALLLLLALTLSGCGAGKTAQQMAPAPAPTALPPRPVAFAYEGRRGPERWGALTRRYALCADGSAQSPIDLARPTVTRLPDLRFDYRPGALLLTATTHTVQADHRPGSTLAADGQRYELLQFHFHEPSEHRLAGRRFPGELHLVHRDADGRLAVVGLLLRAGRRNAALAPVFDLLPEQEGGTATVARFATAAVLPRTGRRFFTYGGSLTTPPCAEGVRWYVLRDPVEVSRAQLAAFRRVVDANARPTQPRQGRVVRLDAG